MSMTQWSPQPSVLSVGGEIHSLALRYFKQGNPIEQALTVARAERDRYAKDFNVVLSDEDLGKAVCLAYGTDPKTSHAARMGSRCRRISLQALSSGRAGHENPFFAAKRATKKASARVN